MAATETQATKNGGPTVVRKTRGPRAPKTFAQIRNAQLNTWDEMTGENRRKMFATLVALYPELLVHSPVSAAAVA